MLLNDDVIREIVQHLSLVPERPEDFRTFLFNDNTGIERLHMRTLASAALTCKAFSEPASEALWAVLPDGLLPLLHTFSSLRITYKTSYMGSRKHVQAMYYVSSNVTLHLVEVSPQRPFLTDSRGSDSIHRNAASSTPRCPRKVCVRHDSDDSNDRSIGPDSDAGAVQPALS